MTGLSLWNIGIGARFGGIHWAWCRIYRHVQRVVGIFQFLVNLAYAPRRNNLLKSERSPLLKGNSSANLDPSHTEREREIERDRDTWLPTRFGSLTDTVRLLTPHPPSNEEHITNY